MKELRRNLTGTAGNALARLFNIDLKRLVVKALKIIASMPELKRDAFEHYNSREFLNLRDELLSHDKVARSRKHLKAVFDFVIMLYDSDEYYRQRIDWVISRLETLPLKAGEPVRPEWWQE